MYTDLKAPTCEFRARPPSYNGRVTSDRPDYKDHPLWTEAIALAHEAYAVADALRASDPEEARLLRKAAVSVPAHVAGALVAEQEEQRAADVSGARAALTELAARAGQISTRPGSGDLRRRAEALQRSVILELGLSDSGLPC